MPRGPVTLADKHQCYQHLCGQIEREWDQRPRVPARRPADDARAFGDYLIQRIQEELVTATGHERELLRWSLDRAREDRATLGRPDDAA